MIKCNYLEAYELFKTGKYIVIVISLIGGDEIKEPVKKFLPNRKAVKTIRDIVYTDKYYCFNNANEANKFLFDTIPVLLTQDELNRIF